jgi:hypothetical protein
MTVETSIDAHLAAIEDFVRMNGLRGEEQNANLRAHSCK